MGAVEDFCSYFVFWKGGVSWEVCEGYNIVFVRGTRVIFVIRVEWGDQRDDECEFWGGGEMMI